MNPQDQQQDQQIDPEVAKIVKALALTENGGKVDVKNPKAGQSGEMKSLFQFTPGTWKMYSNEVLGQDVPLTSEAEAAVVYHKVAGWLKAGFNASQIASIWNSGKPDSYLQDHKGTNKYGVKFDTPGYVKKFESYLKDSSQISDASQPQPVAPPQPTPPVSTQPSVTPPTKNPIKQNRTLPELLQKQIKPVSSPSLGA